MTGRAIGIVGRWRALGAVATLVLGVGVTAGVFSFLQSMVAPPLRGELAEGAARLVRVPALQNFVAYRGLVDELRTLDIGVHRRVTAWGAPSFLGHGLKGESDVTRRWGYGSVEAGEGSWVGVDGGSPEGDRSRR